MKEKDNVSERLKLSTDGRISYHKLTSFRKLILLLVDQLPLSEFVFLCE